MRGRDVCAWHRGGRESERASTIRAVEGAEGAPHSARRTRGGGRGSARGLGFVGSGERTHARTHSCLLGHTNYLCYNAHAWISSLMTAIVS